MLLRTALAISVLVQISGSELITDSFCKAPGVNPHPHDSKVFLVCANDHGKLLVTETVPCPEGYVYSVSEKTCVRGQQSQPASLPTNSRRTRAVTPGACKMSGPYCDSCDRLVVCANMGDNDLRALINISCSETDPEMICSKAVCTTQATGDAACDGSAQAGAFRCLQPGLFPDPNNCKMYHACGSDLSHYSGECDDQFNADSGTCTGMDSGSAQPPPNTQPPACSPPMDVCKGAKTAPTSFTNYPSYYAICIPVVTSSKKPTRYQVAVVKCPGSQVFNDDKRACEMTCDGKRGRFPDPDNCRSYFECPPSSPPKTPAATKKCPENQAFDKARKLCLPENMVQACQRTRAAETSTPDSTTITQAITASSLPATTQTIPSVGFQCQSNGAFPDDSNCRRYIVCSLESRSDGARFRIRRKQCPIFTIFNPRGFCQFGFCWD